MKVFISWSGLLSQKIAEVLKSWLPVVLQSVEPYFTPSDIEKGSRWSIEIASKLKESKIGIFIYTNDNLNSQWMLFEAGAISNALDRSKVCPILFGIDNSDFSGPLTQFQTSQFNKTDFKKLIITINNNNESKLDDKILDDVFETYWPKLESKISTILKDFEVKNIFFRKDRELLEEILELARLNSVKFHQGLESESVCHYDHAELEILVNDFLNSCSVLFDWDWHYTKTCLNNENVDMFISPNGDFLSPNVDEKHSNWANREGFLNAYRNLQNFMAKNEITVFEGTRSGSTNFGSPF